MSNLKGKSVSHLSLSIRFEIAKQIAIQMQNSNELKNILNVAITELRKAIGCDRIVIAQTKVNGKIIVIAESAISSYSVLGQSFYDPCVSQQARISIVEDSNQVDSKCFQELLRTINVRTSLVIPIEVNQSVWGFLACHNRSLFEWSESTLSLISEVINFIEVIIGQLGFLQTNKKKEKYVSTMTEIYLLLIGANSSTDFDIKLQNALQLIANSVHAEGFFLFNGSVCIQRNSDAVKESLPLRGIVHFLQNNITVTKDMEALGDDFHQWLEMQSITSIVFIPIFIEQKYWGFLGLENYKTSWGEAEQAIFSKIAYIIAHIASQREINESLKTSLTEIISNAPIIAYRLNRNGDVVFAEGTHLQSLFPCSRPGQNLFEIKEEYPEVVSFFKKAFASKRLSGTMKIGSAVLNNYTVLLPSGDISGIAVDITELSVAQQDLETIIYAISHDLKEPIRATGNNLKLLEKRLVSLGISDEEISKRLKIGEKNIKRASKLIDEQLELSRINRKGKPFTICNAQEIIDETLEVLADKISQTKTDVQVIAPMPNIKCDRMQISLLFQNLISNAIKFQNKQDAPKIWISCQSTQKSHYWQFSIADNGIGIEPIYHEQIFEIWKRLHEESEFAGTGIGLAICDKIVKRHRGKIWVASDGINKGSVFYFTIPNENFLLISSETTELKGDAI